MQPETDPSSQTLLTWRAPLRAHNKSGKEVIRFSLALCFLLSSLVWLFGDKILILPIVAVTFVFFVLTTTPSLDSEYTINRFGVTLGGTSLHYEDIASFYFLKKYDFDILVLILKDAFGSRVYMTLDTPETKLQVSKLLSQKLIYLQHPPHTVSDKMATWLTTLIPGEK